MKPFGHMVSEISSTDTTKGSGGKDENCRKMWRVKGEGLRRYDNIIVVFVGLFIGKKNIAT
jgi:hypothetical protein